MPACSAMSSGSVRAALFWMSSCVMTVTLAGMRRTSSGKRGAVMTTTSSAQPLEKTAAPARKPAMAWRIETSLASSPTPQWLMGASRPVSGLARHGIPPSDVIDTVAEKSGLSLISRGMLLSLTVAGAVEGFHREIDDHLFPEHPGACRYHSFMRWIVVAALLFGFDSRADIAVRDDYGNTVRLGKPAARIVSLAPHLTELVYAAGAGASMVGAVAYSDYPAAARELPRVGGDTTVSLEAVLALKPDLIVAWPNPGSVRIIDRLGELALPVFRSEPRELEDIATTIERLGALGGTPKEAQGAARAFRARKAELERRYANRANVRVFYQVWSRPL